MSLIPKKAKRVFKGEIFDTYQWPQKMYDGSTATFEAVKRHNGVSILATVKDKIIVLKQKQPNTNWYYTIPGGYVDPGESIKQAAIRELREETGYKAKSYKVWKSYEGSNRVESKYQVLIARDCEKAGEQQLDGGEIIEVKLMSFEKFLKLSDNPLMHNRDLIIELLRARVSKAAKSRLKKVIFG